MISPSGRSSHEATHGSKGSLVILTREAKLYDTSIYLLAASLCLALFNLGAKFLSKHSLGSCCALVQVFVSELYFLELQKGKGERVKREELAME